MRECAPPRRARARGRDAGTRARVPPRQCPVPRTDGRHSSARLDLPFGAVRGGVGRESLTVGGTPVPLLANGAWIAWVPLPDDTIAAFRLVARSGGDSVVQDVTARIAPRYRPPPGRAAWIDTTSFAPSGTLALPPGEGIRPAARVTPGAVVRLRLPWGATIPFIPDTLPGEPAWGVRAFATTATAYRLPTAADRYVAWLPAAPLCPAGKSAC